ncbi:hypothetical protein C2E20_5610 [Micractinium conductrix]|uniref:Glycosyltransferase family 92 protein n=1 Tax=Micractinium conductrix TaxID=554055 RepID=A0A2P6V9T2_9CHLO|nr:hypothetical protein C2E20_5610 [Micractinium conductrix]|eukprot:PSC70849.1 hypothetical protein C2E20_5610 [Micractinium conductrix]
MLALLVGSSLIGSSTRELQRSAKFLAQPLSRSSTAAVAVAAAAAVGTTNATSTVEPWATAGVDLPDCRPSGPHRRTFTPQELALHEARLEAWRSGAAQGVAMCLVVKDQREDLAEWVEYHLGLGVAHIYVYDTGSEPPLRDVLQPWTETSQLTYFYITDFKAAAADLTATTGHHYRNLKYKQWIVYSMCLRDYGARHQWLAFIDSDEFLVITDGTPDLPTLLRDYERYGGLAANWRILGSSGHQAHQDSTLLAYTACYPPRQREQLLTKSVVNTAWAVQPAAPHNAYYVGGCHAVLSDGSRVDKPSSKHIVHDRLSVYHYITKSLQDFEAKMVRGGGLGVIHRNMGFWDKGFSLPAEEQHPLELITSAAALSEASIRQGVAGVASPASRGSARSQESGGLVRCSVRVGSQAARHSECCGKGGAAQPRIRPAGHPWAPTHSHPMRNVMLLCSTLATLVDPHVTALAPCEQLLARSHSLAPVLEDLLLDQALPKAADLALAAAAMPAVAEERPAGASRIAAGAAAAQDGRRVVGDDAVWLLNLLSFLMADGGRPVMQQCSTKSGEHGARRRGQLLKLATEKVFTAWLARCWLQVGRCCGVPSLLGELPEPTDHVRDGQLQAAVALWHSFPAAVASTRVLLAVPAQHKCTVLQVPAAAGGPALAETEGRWRRGSEAAAAAAAMNMPDRLNGLAESIVIQWEMALCAVGVYVSMFMRGREDAAAKELAPVLLRLHCAAGRLVHWAAGSPEGQEACHLLPSMADWTVIHSQYHRTLVGMLPVLRQWVNTQGTPEPEKLLQRRQLQAELAAHAAAWPLLAAKAQAHRTGRLRVTPAEAAAQLCVVVYVVAASGPPALLAGSPLLDSLAAAFGRGQPAIAASSALQLLSACAAHGRLAVGLASRHML